jgi:hypothetical protein
MAKMLNSAGVCDQAVAIFSSLSDKWSDFE